jgi:hypothetical protein
VREILFWAIVAIVVGGQVLLVQAAWRLHRHPAVPPTGVPHSDSRADLLWTLGTAVLTIIVLGFAYLTLA